MHTPRSFDKEPYQNFQIKDCVYIQRTSGYIEIWRIDEFLSNGSYIVRPIDGQKMYREETLEELQELNLNGPIDQETLNLINKAYYFYVRNPLSELLIDKSINIDWYLKDLDQILSEIKQSNSPVLREYERLFQEIKSAIANKEWENQETQNLLDEIYPNGIESDLSQGRIGTCYLLSSLKALKIHPELMKLIVQKSIRKKDKNTWVVTFLGDEENIGPIEISRNKINEWKKRSKLQAALGDIIFELAYASYKSRSKGREKKTMYEEEGSKSLAIEGGHAHKTLLHILGPLGVKYSLVPHKKPDEHRSFAKANDHSAIPNFFENEYTKNQHRLIITASSEYSPGGDKDYEFIDGEKIYKNHAYTVVGYNPNTRTLSLSNPHNSKKTFMLSIHGFNQIFNALRHNKISRLAVIIMQLEHINSEEIIRGIIRSELSKEDLYTLTQSQYGNPEHLRENIEYTLAAIKNPLVKKVAIEELNSAEERQGI